MVGPLLAAVLGTFPVAPEADEVPAAVEYSGDAWSLRPRALAQLRAGHEAGEAPVWPRRLRAGADARLGSWALDLNVGWEGSSGRGPEVLDARAVLDRLDWATLVVGAGKVPVGRAQLTPAAYLQLPERARALAPTRDGGLVPDRRAGVTLGGDLGLVAYGAGVYAGGAGALPGRDDRGTVAAARLELRPIGPVGLGEGGWNPAEPWYDWPRLSLGFSYFREDLPGRARRGGGADAWFKLRGLSLGVEGIADSRDRWGAAGQGGWFVVPGRVELAARYERDDAGWNVAGGGTVILTRNVRLQLFGERRDRRALAQIEGRL